MAFPQGELPAARDHNLVSFCSYLVYSNNSIIDMNVIPSEILPFMSGKEFIKTYLRVEWREHEDSPSRKREREKEKAKRERKR